MIGAEKRPLLTRLEGMSIKEDSSATNLKEKGASSRDSPNTYTKESSHRGNPFV